LQVRKDVCEFLVGDHFAGVRRHLARGLVDIFGERLEGKLWRANARPRSLRGTLALAAMAFIAAVFRKNLLAGFGVSRGNRLAFFSLRSGILRWQRESRNATYSNNRIRSEYTRP